MNEKIRTCDWCGEDFDMMKFGLQGDGNSFCSFKCCDDWQDDQAEKEESETLR